MKQKRKNKLEKFPGGEIVSKGLNDILHGKFRSIEALAVFMASPRLNELGFHINENYFDLPHLLLYEKLKRKYVGEAYSQYKAVLTRVAKFCNHYK